MPKWCCQFEYMYVTVCVALTSQLHQKCHIYDGSLRCLRCKFYHYLCINLPIATPPTVPQNCSDEGHYKLIDVLTITISLQKMSDIQVVLLKFVSMERSIGCVLTIHLQTWTAPHLF